MRRAVWGRRKENLQRPQFSSRRNPVDPGPCRKRDNHDDLLSKLLGQWAEDSLEEPACPCMAKVCDARSAGAEPGY